MKTLILAALVALQPAAALAAGWVLVLRESERFSIVVVPGRYATKLACVAAGNAAKSAFSGSGIITYACIPGP